MKFLTVILASAICVSLAVGQRCESGDDCDKGKCCVTYTPGLFVMGHCQKLLKKGDECMPDLLNHIPGEKNLYFMKCPCDEGLECIWSGGLSPSCVPTVTTTGTTEATTAMGTQKLTNIVETTIEE